MILIINKNRVSEIIELISRVATKIMDAIRNIARSACIWFEELTEKYLDISEMELKRNSWFKNEFTRALKAHKKGNPLFLTHQVINRKPKQNFARANL